MVPSQPTDRGPSGRTRQPETQGCGRSDPNRSRQAWSSCSRPRFPRFSICAEKPSMSDKRHFIRFPLLLRVDTHIARFAGYSQSLETTPAVPLTLTSTTFGKPRLPASFLSGEMKCASMRESMHENEGAQRFKSAPLGQTPHLRCLSTRRNSSRVGLHSVVRALPGFADRRKCRFRALQRRARSAV